LSTSKAIWTGLVGSAWGVAGTLGLLPEGLSQTDGLTVVLAITGIGGVVLRKAVVNLSVGPAMCCIANELHWYCGYQRTTQPDGGLLQGLHSARRCPQTAGQAAPPCSLRPRERCDGGSGIR